ncbi:hypothetical protein FACS1894111_05560 [Clostridia bacterium]|nr:hypothetical protein FACS1894111_05560 [Clostridia bacterium]
MTNFDDLKLAVEALSGGTNTVRLDDLGMPSILVPFPKLKYSDVITGGTQDALPAFIVDGQEKDVIHVSKYQNVIVNERAYSLPMKDPATSLNFDRALTVCRNKGPGWHLKTNALWAAIALWCKKNGTQPNGNNNYGQDITNPWEKGVPTYKETSGAFRPLRTGTGSGPVSWYHNYDSSGIADLNGNVWEWVSGLRLKNGEIQIIPYGNAMKLDCNMSDTSTEWKAILQDGTLVSPGTANTLKINSDVAGDATQTNHRVGNPVLDIKRDNPAYTGGEVNDYYGELSRTFETFAAASGVTVPILLKALGIFPADASGYNGDNFWVRNYGERLPLRGGGWADGANAGVFALHLADPRSYVGTHLGFRSAFYE